MRNLAVFLVVAVSSLPALAAGFEGSIEMSIKNDRAGAGALKLSLGDPGTVSELTMPTPQGSMVIKSLMQKAHPESVYLINDAQKTYSELPVPPQGAKMPGDDQTWTVKKIGSEKIAGYDTVHVTATGSRGDNFELWTAKDIMSSSDFVKAQGSGNRVPTQLVTALKDAGADGFFARLVAGGKDGSKTTMELTKVTKGALPKNAFEIPTGYTKAAAGLGGMGGAIPPDVQKQMQDKMKTLTPEQQEAMKKAMAGHP
ncbi:MAG TPA: DUF4412 domain-containing protein [Myxococcota bacterium]